MAALQKQRDLQLFYFHLLPFSQGEAGIFEFHFDLPQVIFENISPDDFCQGIFYLTNGIFAGAFPKAATLQALIAETKEAKTGSEQQLSFSIKLAGGKGVLQIHHPVGYPDWFWNSFGETFQHLLVKLADGESLLEITLLTDEQAALTRKINAEAKHSHLYQTIPEAFAAAVKKYPHNTAVVCGDESLIYWELNAQVQRILSALNHRGIVAGDTIGVMMAPGIHLLPVLLAVLSLGGVYVPVNEEYPESWKQQVLETAQVKQVIVAETKSAAFLKDQFEILALNQLDDGFDVDLFNTAIQVGDPACIIFTSGSTGKPKGVVLTQGGLANVCQWCCRSTGMNDKDVFAMYQNIAFVSHIEPVFAALFVGACVDMIPKEVRLNMHALDRYFREHHISMNKMGASAGKQFLAAVSQPSFRILILGGEKLGEITQPEGCRIIDGYGPTENTAQVSAAFVDEKSEIESVGTPIDNIEVYVLNENHREVPVGAVGTLYTGGVGVASGYLNEPEKTAAAFIPNPFDGGKTRIYHTGDLVRRLSDGAIAFIGRGDDQIKVHGCRVELSEVEQVIADLPQVNQCVCVSRPEGTDNMIIAYVTLNPGEPNASTMPQIIKRQVSCLRPAYMVPAYVMVLDGFPLTYNGKVDKKALPLPNLSQLKNTYAAPTTPLEKKLVALYEEVFQIEAIGIDDDFIDLGGDSLSAMMLLTGLPEYNLTAADVLTCRTPRAIAKRAAELDYSFMADYPYHYETGYPFTTFQMMVYLDITKRDEKNVHMMPCEVDVPGYTVAEVLAAIDKLIEVHPILCDYVDDSGDRPWNRHGNKPEIIVKEQVTEEEKHAFVIRPFDYHKTLCAILVSGCDYNVNVIILCQHILTDMASHIVLRRHLKEILSGKELPMDDGMLRLASFEEGLPHSAMWDEAKQWYTALMAPNVPHCAHVPHSPGDPNSRKGGLIIRLYDLDMDVFTAFLKKHHSSPGAFLTTVFGYTLCLFSHRDRAAYLTTVNGRDRLNLTDSFGSFNRLLVYLTNADFERVDDFMAHATKSFYDLLNYDYYSTFEVMGTYGLDDSVFCEYLPGELSANKLALYPVENGKYYKVFNGVDEIAQTDISCEMLDLPEGYGLYIEHSPLYSKAFIENFCETYDAVVRQLMTREFLSEIAVSLIDEE